MQENKICLSYPIIYFHQIIITSIRFFKFLHEFSNSDPSISNLVEIWPPAFPSIDLRSGSIIHQRYIPFACSTFAIPRSNRIESNLSGDLRSRSRSIPSIPLLVAILHANTRWLKSKERRESSSRRRMHARVRVWWSQRLTMFHASRMEWKRGVQRWEGRRSFVKSRKRPRIKDADGESSDRRVLRGAGPPLAKQSRHFLSRREEFHFFCRSCSRSYVTLRWLRCDGIEGMFEFIYEIFDVV